MDMPEFPDGFKFFVFMVLHGNAPATAIQWKKHMKTWVKANRESIRRFFPARQTSHVMTPKTTTSPDPSATDICVLLFRKKNAIGHCQRHCHHQTGVEVYQQPVSIALLKAFYTAGRPNEQAIRSSWTWEWRPASGIALFLKE